MLGACASASTSAAPRSKAIALDDDGARAGAAAHRHAARRLRRRRSTRRARSCERLESAAGTRGTVGVGMPGAISPATGLVKNANSTWLNGRPLGRRSVAPLGGRVRFANDANCFALSEATDGAAAGARVVFGVIVGTGTGGGIVLDGRGCWSAPTRSPASGGTTRCRGRASDEWPGPPCYCGKTRLHRDVPLRPRARARLRRRRAEAIDAPDDRRSRERAATPRAQATLARYEDRLARALATRHQHARPRRDRARRRPVEPRPALQQRPAPLVAYIFSDRVDTRLVRATTATRAACAARPGSGTRSKPIWGMQTT